VNQHCFYLIQRFISQRGGLADRKSKVQKKFPNLKQPRQLKPKSAVAVEKDNQKSGGFV